jgi:hypothetical protein
MNLGTAARGQHRRWLHQLRLTKPNGSNTPELRPPVATLGPAGCHGPNTINTTAEKSTHRLLAYSAQTRCQNHGSTDLIWPGPHGTHDSRLRAWAMRAFPGAPTFPGAL